MNKTIEYLSSHQSDTPSHWRENAQWRRDNDDWLRYAQFITLQVMKRMDEQGVTQKQLAERIGCSQQYVSNLLKGSTNMTLETIARLEKALNIDIVRSKLTYVREYETSQNPHYINKEKPPYGDK
ncbi:MAG: helix-turn-helix transcriptional regulator [Bacteroidaceae bacterium]|nr:helix-turn-helix transcriptional regulator [Bacteroidaceae bacterium]